MSEWEEHEEPTDAEIAWLYGENGRPEPSSWKPKNLAHLPDRPPVEPTLGGLGFLYPGKRHLFSGPQESAKTLAAYIAAIKVIRQGGGVVLMDFEMGEWDARERLRDLGATDDEIASIAYIAPEEPPTEADIAHLVAQGPSLVIIDATAGAFDLLGLDDNQRKDVERFHRLLISPFRKAQIATLVLDHVVKNVEARGNYAIGSERKAGGVDIHLGFAVIDPIKRGARGAFKITTHKDRGGFLKRGKLAEFTLSSDPESHAISWVFRAAADSDDEHRFRPTHLMEKVSRYLERQVGPVNVGELKVGVTGNHAAVLDGLAILVAEGYVEETEGPRKARLLESLKAYREEADDSFLTHSDPFSETAEPTHSPFPSLEGMDGDGVARHETTHSDVQDDDDGIPF